LGRCFKKDLTGLNTLSWWNYTTPLERILNETDLCASPARALLARGKTQKFPIIFICGSPPHPPPQGGKFERKEIFGFAAAASI